MTGAEHYHKAERLMESISSKGSDGRLVISTGYPEVIAAAQVHATLALAASTAWEPDSPHFWDVGRPKSEAAGSPRPDNDTFQDSVNCQQPGAGTTISDGHTDTVDLRYVRHR